MKDLVSQEIDALTKEIFTRSQAMIAATKRVMAAFPGKPSPEFQVAYYVEEKYIDNKGSEKVKRVHFRGEAVGLVSNANCGTIENAVWSEKFNQWSYTIYPWSGDREEKRACENVILPIYEWMSSKLGQEVMAEVNEYWFGNDSNIYSHYMSLMSGRCSNVPATIKNLKRLVKEHKGT